MPDISLPIIDTILHPPIGLLHPVLDNNGPISGTVTIAGTNVDILGVPTDIAVGQTWGVQWQPNGAVPPNLGYRVGWVSDDALYDEAEYHERILQIVVQHQFSSGAWVTTQKQAVNSFPGAITWDVAIPGRVGFNALPGWSFDLFWLRIV